MKAELDAAKVWEENWGPLFAPDEPHNYEERIKKLEDEAAKCVARERGRARLLLRRRSRDAPSLTRALAHPPARAAAGSRAAACYRSRPRTAARARRSASSNLGARRA